MTYIFLLSTPQTARVIASATHPQHAAKAHFTKLTCPSFLSATVPQAWEMASRFNIDKVLRQMPTNTFQHGLHKLSNARDYFEGNDTPVCLDVMLQHLLTTTHTEGGKFWSHMQYDKAWRTAIVASSDFKKIKNK